MKELETLKKERRPVGRDKVYITDTTKTRGEYLELFPCGVGD